MKETSVIAAIWYTNRRIIYGTELSIVPKHWNKCQKEAHSMNGILGMEFNTSLRRFENRIEETFKKFHNNAGRIPSKWN